MKERESHPMSEPLATDTNPNLYKTRGAAEEAQHVRRHNNITSCHVLPVRTLPA